MGSVLDLRDSAMGYCKAAPFSGPPFIAATALLCLAWILPGLIGHDPWKPDEAYTFGLVYHILQSGDWVVPTLAGEPFISAIILVGCVGLLIRTHQLITDVSLLTGFSLAIYGLALSLRRPILAGVWLGAGAGIGFMSKGLLAPGMLGIISLLLPVVFKSWRNRGYCVCLFVALLVAMPWLTIWPVALYFRSPALFMEWFWVNNLGGYWGSVILGGLNRGHAFYLKLLPWYAWPALPLALWSLWENRRAITRTPGVQLPLIAFSVILVVLSLTANSRELYALPVLLPLSLLATASLTTLPRVAAVALNWLGVLVFGLVALLLWLGWIALMTNQPAAIAVFLKNYQPGFESTFSGATFGIALAFTLLWLVTVCSGGRSNLMVALIRRYLAAPGSRLPPPG